MPSKIPSIPLRLGDERLARVKEFAERTRAKSQHAAILALIDGSLDHHLAATPLAVLGSLADIADPPISPELAAEVAKRRGKSRVAAAVLATAKAPEKPKHTETRAAALKAGADLMAKPNALVAPEAMHAGTLVPLAGTFDQKPLQKASAQPKRKWKV